MLNVLLTIDTEIWPSDPEWPERSLPRPWTTMEQDYESCILGKTRDGQFGLPFILGTLRRHDLKGIFFVESLSASAIGSAHLQKTVAMIREYEQDVQLHVHTEWLSEINCPDLPFRHRQNLSDFDRCEQTTIVRHAKCNLLSAGASNVMALRAGNMGGNRDTPFAARAAGLALDMSFDLSHGPPVRAMVSEVNGLPADAGACPTVPLSCVEDFPGHFRPAQITALSFAELREAVLFAERVESPYFMLLLHSFELVTRDKGQRARQHRINIDRFNKVCVFLARHRDRFATVGCAALRPGSLALCSARIPRTSSLRMIWRVGEQLASRAL